MRRPSKICKRKMELIKCIWEAHLVDIFKKYRRDIALERLWQVLIYQEAEATHLETEHNGALSVRERRV